MDIPHLERRLGAVLVADVVGFSRHMERNEAATFSRLREVRERVIDPKLGLHAGRLIKSTGDGVLVEFPSALAALRAAIEIQREMGVRNLYLAPDARFELRIGINLGDIIVDGTDIAGDGVNVAARLESLAAPGGICVSAAVRDQVHEELDTSFVDIGEQQVKNIARPIRAYRVALVAGSTAPEATKGRSKASSPRVWWVAGGTVTLAVAIVTVWLLAKPGSTRVTFAPPPMSLAVMPFAVSAGDAAEQAVADAIAHDVANEFERAGRGSFRMTSPDLTAAYKGKPIDPRAVGRELNVRYLAEGELRRAGDRVIVTTKLVDTTQALQAWSERAEIDFARAASAQGQHELATGLAYRLRLAVRNAEIRRIGADPSQAAGAVELLLLGDSVWEQDANETSGARKARPYYEQALKLDPNSVPALLRLADVLDTEMWNDPFSNAERILPQLDDLTRRAQAAEPQNHEVWFVRAVALTWQHRWDSALEAYRRAEEIDPSRLFPVVRHAFLLLNRGQPDAAIELADKVIRKDPLRGQATRSALRVQCEAYLVLDRVDEAIAACDRSLAGWDRWHTHLLLAAAHARSGNLEAASSHRAALVKQLPGFSIATYEAFVRRYSNEHVYVEQRERAIIPGLRKAGVPER